MAESINSDILTILRLLSSANRDVNGESWVDSNYLAGQSNLTAPQINDATAILERVGYVEIERGFGSAPYDFHEIAITPMGRYEYERMKEHNEQQMEVIKLRPPVPIGSPYGFIDEDWEAVSRKKADSSMLYVVLGYQFDSQHYHTDILKQNVSDMFQRAVDKYNQKITSSHIKLYFKALNAGYGEHLFNEIARDIISADIAVFETSDMNPNVMIEIGVALTWGVRVLLIKEHNRPKPPSDISGHTYANYEKSAEVFQDQEHDTKLLSMIERAILKKPRP